MRRRQCAASSTPTSGRLSATASSASRLATSRIDGRVATTLAARGARDRSAISPKSAPLTSRASVMGRLPSSLAGSRREHLELAARDDVRLGALFALVDDHGAPPGTVIISKAPTRSRSASLGSALKSGSGAVSGISEPAASSYSRFAAWMICVAFEVSAGPVRNELSGWKSSKFGSGGGGGVGLGQARRALAERARHLIEVAAHVDAERAKIADGRDGEREVRGVDRARTASSNPSIAASGRPICRGAGT